MKETRWIFENLNKNFYRDILNKKNLKRDNIISNIIEDRNLTLENNFSFEIEDFKDLDVAVERIITAIEKKEKIFIYGDYDVDGITSVSLLYLSLTELGADVDYFIPLRDEGYGLNKEAIYSLKEKNANLVISVDCGINSISEIDYANSLNLDFVITDHHEITGNIPNALAVINPKREENLYKFKYLAGVGTAFVLAYVLYKKLNKLEEIFKYLDIVAIGTVADVVPLKEENRKFVSRGLLQLNLSKWIGIKQLLKKIFPEEFETKKYSTYDIGYIIAPIFNAVGRLEDAKNAVKLFLEKDPFICLAIIDELLENNMQRKNIQKNILEISLKEIEKKSLNKKALILVAREEFHHGVIGIVASKIVDKYYKPTIIMEIKKELGIATASCRSVEGINIVECLNQVNDILIKYGGHSGAAGFTISIDKIEEFYSRVNEYIENNFTAEVFIKNIKINQILSPYKINYDFLIQLSQLEPFGSGNTTPIFAFKNCDYSNLRYTKNGNEHIIFDVIKDGYFYKNCIFFGGGEYYDLIAKSKRIDIAFKLKLEIFKDRYVYKLQIEDIKKSDQNEEFKDIIDLNGKDLNFPLCTVIYTRRKDINKGDNLQLKFNEYGIEVIKDKILIATLDENLAKILYLLKKDLNYKFTARVKEKIFKTENINLVLEIDREENFYSLALKDAKLFTEIKEYLIGNLNYNSIQKKVLSAVFKEKKRTLAILKKGRGISTIEKTILLFFNSNQKKVLFNDLEEEADFYIVDDLNYINKYKVTNFKDRENLLLISSEKISLENFSVVEDDIKIPENIEFIDYEDIKKENKNIFHKFLKRQEQIEILEKVKRGEKIYSTLDIKIYL